MSFASDSSALTAGAATTDRVQIDPGLMDAEWMDGPGGFTGIEPTQEWADEVRRLARARNATLLAHNYQLPAI